jgi:hypothetical protein
LHNDQGNQDDAIGIWSFITAEAPAGTDNDSVKLASESFTIGNVQISGVTGGSAIFNGITSVGLFSAVGSSDAGTFDVGGTLVNWDDLNDGDAFQGGDLDGGGGNSLDLASAYADAGGVGIITGFDLTRPTGTGSNAWRLDAVQFDVTTSTAAIPEPSSLLLLSAASLGLIIQRRRRRRDIFDGTVC